MSRERFECTEKACKALCSVTKTAWVLANEATLSHRVTQGGNGA
jgi:hypothetical protein